MAHAAALVKCRAILKRVCTRRSDDLIVDMLTKTAVALEADTQHPPMIPLQHTLDLDLDGDVQYLLSSTYLELAKLHAKRGNLDDAQRLCRLCLLLFPRSISGMVEMAQVKVVIAPSH